MFGVFSNVAVARKVKLTLNLIDTLLKIKVLYVISVKTLCYKFYF